MEKQKYPIYPVTQSAVQPSVSDAHLSQRTKEVKQ